MLALIFADAVSFLSQRPEIVEIDLGYYEYGIERFCKGVQENMPVSLTGGG